MSHTAPLRLALAALSTELQHASAHAVENGECAYGNTAAHAQRRLDRLVEHQYGDLRAALKTTPRKSPLRCDVRAGCPVAALRIVARVDPQVGTLVGDACGF